MVTAAPHSTGSSEGDPQAASPSAPNDRGQWFLLSLFVLSLVGMAALFAIQGPRLPDPMPSKFDIQGEATRWMPRGNCLAVLGGVFFGTAFLVVLPAFFIHKVPASLVSLPYKDNMADLRGFLRTKGRCYCFGIAICITWMYAALTWLIFEAALKNPPYLSAAIWIVPLAFMAAIFALTGWFITAAKNAPRI